MPVFSIETPSGKVLDIEAGNEQDALRGASEWHAANSPQVGVAEDVAKALPVGLAKGAIGLAGMPGDSRAFSSYLTDQVGSLTGMSPETIAKLKGIGSAALNVLPGGNLLANAPTSHDITQKVEGVTGEFYKPQTLPGKIAQTVGEFAPAAIGGPEAIASRVLQRAVLPGVASELAGQATEGTSMEPFARLVGGVGGAMVGPAAMNVAQRAVTPFPINQARSDALNTLRNEGVQLPAGMSTGSRMLSAAESELGGQRYKNAVNNAQEQFTAAAINKLSPNAGVAGERAWTPQTINRAEDTVGKVFDTVAARNPSIAMDKVGVDSLKRVADDFEALTGARSSLLDRFVKQINSTGAAPSISGESYQALSSEISRYSRAASQNPELRIALGDIKGALDSAVERGLKNSKDLQEWKQARKDWHNILLLNKSVSGSPEAAANGLITPAKLTQAIDGMKRGNYAHGRTDFAELARAGNQVMRQFPDSGTSSRWRAAAIPAAIGAVMGGGFGAIPAAAAAVAAPFAAGRALMSRPVQSYLQNQALSGPPSGILGNMTPQQFIASSLPPRPF